MDKIQKKNMKECKLAKSSVTFFYAKKTVKKIPTPFKTNEIIRYTYQTTTLAYFTEAVKLPCFNTFERMLWNK